MKSKLEQYVENIVRYTEGSKQEKEDLFEELLIHLELSRDNIMKEEGIEQEEAEEKAMKLFGKEGEIGSGIQQALFPYRKELMLTLAISSILATITIYLLNLFIDGDAVIGWLLFSMTTGGLLLFLPLNQRFHINRKLWLNSLLVVHILTLLYGVLIVSYLDYATVGLAIWLWLNIAISLALVYRTTIYDFSPDEKSMKLLHGINILLGAVITFLSLFFMFGGLVMIGIHPAVLIFLLPILFWIGSYFVQVKVAKRNIKTAISLGATLTILLIVIVFWLFFPR